MSAWLDVLRQACAGGKQKLIAKRIGYSPSVVNQVLKGKYQGDLKRVQEAVEGALMGSVVDCPVLGEIPRQKCIEHQRSPFRATNHVAVQLHRTCPACPNALNTTKPAKENP